MSNSSSCEEVLHEFSISGRGPRRAKFWSGDHVALFLELDESETICTPSATVRSAILRSFDAIYLTFFELTGFVPSRPTFECRRSSLPIQIPRDNAGAGGLAHHGVVGLSVGYPIMFDLIKRWENACSNGISWLPTKEGPRKFQDDRPNEASIDHVFFYEMNRNFWPPWFNCKIDWICDNDESCWGWWTVGMNNAMAIIIPTILNLPFYYFGHSLSKFRNGMIKHLETYVNSYCVQCSNPFNAWTSSRMPWNNKESVNDLMTGFIVRSFEQFGGDVFIKRMFRGMKDLEDINAGVAGERNYQKARDNIYKLWSYAAEEDLYQVFTEELKWEITDSSLREVRENFPGPSLLSLSITY